MRQKKTAGLSRPFFIFGILWSLLCFGPPCLKAEGDAGQPGAYLRNGVGARALGLSNAYAANAEGAEAVFWNPAALGLMEQSSFMSSLSSLSLNRQASDAELAWPLGQHGAGAGTWALGWDHYSLGNDFEGRSSDTASYYSFGDNQNAYALATGRSVTPWLFLGANAKLYEHRIDSFSAYGEGLDLGLLLIPLPALRLGVVASDLLSQLRWNTGTTEAFPTSLRLALSSSLFQDRVLLAGQVTEVSGRNLAYEAGLELKIAKILAARAGIQETGFSLGGGLEFPVFKTKIRFDYAFSPDPLNDGDIQEFSLGFYF
jgi:hypothetical protein